MFYLLEVLYISTTQKVRNGRIEKMEAGLTYLRSVHNYFQDRILRGRG